MSTPADYGRLRDLLAQEIAMDVDGMLNELNSIPKRIFRLREKIAPLKAELAMLRAKYYGRGPSPSHYHVLRELLLSELMEEERVRYNRDPAYKTTSAGKQVKIELTDGRAQNLAHAHPRYRKFVEEAETELKRMGEIRKEIGPLYDRIEALAGVAEALKQKIEIGKARTYAFSAEARLTPR